jgi:hypothetical protein
MSRGCGVLPDLAASPCCKACVKLCAWVPAEGGSREDGLRGSGVLKSSSEIRDGVEFVPKVRAGLKHSLGEQNTPPLGD